MCPSPSPHPPPPDSDHKKSPLKTLLFKQKNSLEYESLTKGLNKNYKPVQVQHHHFKLEKVVLKIVCIHLENNLYHIR